MSRSRGATPRVRYRCCACAFEFVPPTPGAAPCPRCQAVGGHEEIATVRPGGGYGVD